MADMISPEGNPNLMAQTIGRAPTLRERFTEAQDEAVQRVLSSARLPELLRDVAGYLESKDRILAAELRRRADLLERVL